MDQAGSNDPRQDELIVVRCQLGERAAFDELIERWHEPLAKYARRLIEDGDAADDLVQDVWLRVLRGIGRLRDGAKLRPWLFGIARRAIMDLLRERYAAPVSEELDAEGLAASEFPFGREEELLAMEGELARLPVAEREVLSLFYLQEMSLTEVAEVIAVPVGTVKSRLHRARSRLRQELESREKNR